jgi:hypothetical protein
MNDSAKQTYHGKRLMNSPKENSHNACSRMQPLSPTLPKSRNGQQYCLIEVKDSSAILRLSFRIEEACCVRSFGFFNAQNERTPSSSV